MVPVAVICCVTRVPQTYKAPTSRLRVRALAPKKLNVLGVEGRVIAIQVRSSCFDGGGNLFGQEQEEGAQSWKAGSEMIHAWLDCGPNHEGCRCPCAVDKAFSIKKDSKPYNRRYQSTETRVRFWFTPKRLEVLGGIERRHIQATSKEDERQPNFLVF